MLLIANLHSRLISSRAMDSPPVEFLNVLYQSDCCCCVFGAGPSSFSVASFRRMWCPMATLDGDKSFIFSLLTINEAEDKQMIQIRLRVIQNCRKNRRHYESFVCWMCAINVPCGLFAFCVAVVCSVLKKCYFPHEKATNTYRFSAEPLINLLNLSVLIFECVSFFVFEAK